MPLHIQRVVLKRKLMRVMDELTPEQVMAAITEGVREAFMSMFADLAMNYVIGDGVKEGVRESLDIDTSDVTDAIQKGTFSAMDQVYGSQILEAIYNGTKDALTPQ